MGCACAAQRRGGASGAIIMQLSIDCQIANAETRIREQSQHIADLLAEKRDARDACAVLAMMLRALEQIREIRETLHSFHCHH